MLCRDAPNFKRIARIIKTRYRAPGRRGKKPTFSEFVSFLTDPRTERPFDRHWRPFHKLCKPCQVRYDFIGHLETLLQDANYLLNKIGLQNAELVYRNPSTKNASSIVAEKMATLSKDQLRKLTEIYRLDFLLFGYSTEVQSLR